MPLTLEQKSNVRRHLGFGPAGLMRGNPSGGTLAAGQQGYRFFQAYGQLEFRMNSLAPDEESRLLGKAYGGVMLIGGATLTPGSVGTITFTSPTAVVGQVATYTSIVGDSQLSFIANLASAVNNNSTLASNGILSLAPYGTGPFSQSFLGGPVGNTGVPIPQLGIISAVAFTFTTSFTGTAGTSMVATASGGFLGPSATTDRTTLPFTVTFGYLPILDAVEASLYGAFGNLDTSQADVWTARMDEPEAKARLLKYMRMDLWRFMGFDNASNGTGMGGHGGMSVQI